MNTFVCPGCNSVGQIARIERLKGYATIKGVDEQGQIVWSGSTQIDWESQRAESNPAEFTCLDCGHVCGRDDLIVAADGHKAREVAHEEVRR